MAQSGSALSLLLLFAAVAILSPDPAKFQTTTIPVTLGFEHGPYIVGESSAFLKVCVQVKDGVPQSVLHLSLTTVDGTATASADYINTTAGLRFGPSTRKQCVLIPVINDAVPENQEYFRVKLAMATPQPGIALIPDIVIIFIIDDDGKC